MALIQSGAGATNMTVDPTSAAARATLYDSSGNEILYKLPTASYFANISLQHTAADAAASAVFAMHNPNGSGKTLYLRNIRGRAYFTGTAAAATAVGYEFIRFTVADPTTGTTVPRIKKRNSYAASVVQDANIQQKSGVLTMTSVAYETAPFHVLRLPASVTGTVSEFKLDLVQTGSSWEAFELAPNEGMAIRLHLTAIIGLGLAGSVEWDER